MARGRRGKRRKDAHEPRSGRERQRRAVLLVASLAAIPVGLALAGALLASGTDVDPFQNTADGGERGEVGESVTDDSLVPQALEDDDFFASPSASPEREPTPSGGSEAQSADVTASSGPEGSEEESGDDGSDGGNGGDANGGGGDGGGDGSGSVASASANQVVTLVNEERAEAGCDPLRVDAQLTAAAQEHSEDMDQRGYMDHVNPDGEDPGERASRHGYNAWGAENVAKGQTSPQAVMEAWMNSEGHRQNILNCGLVAIGVGEDNNAWTQKFGWE